MNKSQKMMSGTQMDGAEDDSNDEPHNMTSQMHKMISQHQQVVETTPGHSEKLFTASETVNLTEKNVKLTPRAQQATQ